MKKIELTHDILAEEVFKNSSGLQRMRREAENRIKKRFTDYNENGILVAEDELYNLIVPFLGIVNISDEERSFVIEMEREIAREIEIQNKRKRAIFIGLAVTSIVFSMLFLTTIYLWRLSTDNVQKNKALSFVSLANKAIDDGFPSLGYRLAERAMDITDDSIVKNSFDLISKKVNELPLVNEINVGSGLMDFGFLASHERIFSVHKKGFVKYWNLTGELQQSFHVSDTINFYKKIPKTGHILLVDSENKLILFDLSGKVVFQKSFNREIKGMDLSRDLKKVLVFFAEGEIQVLDITNDSIISHINTNIELVSVRFIKTSIFSKGALLCMSDSSANVLDLENNRLTSFGDVFEEYSVKSLNNLELSYNDSLVIFRSPFGDKVFDVHGYYARDIVSLDFNSGTYVNSQFLNHGQLGRMIGLRPDLQEYTIWDFEKKRVDFQHLISPFKLIWVDASPDLNWISSCSSDNTLIFLKENKTPKPLEVSYDDFLKVKCKVTQGRFSPDGYYFASNNGDSFLKIWFLDQKEVSNSQKNPQLLGDINTRLREFTDSERLMYQIDE